MDTDNGTESLQSLERGAADVSPELERARPSGGSLRPPGLATFSPVEMVLSWTGWAEGRPSYFGELVFALGALGGSATLLELYTTCVLVLRIQEGMVGDGPGLEPVFLIKLVSSLLILFHLLIGALGMANYPLKPGPHDRLSKILSWVLMAWGTLGFLLLLPPPVDLMEVPRDFPYFYAAFALDGVMLIVLLLAAAWAFGMLGDPRGRESSVQAAVVAGLGWVIFLGGVGSTLYFLVIGIACAALAFLRLRGLFPRLRRCLTERKPSEHHDSIPQL